MSLSIFKKKLKPEYGEYFRKYVVFAGAFALPLALFASCQAMTVETAPETDTVAEVRMINRAQNWSHDFMVLWLGGSDDGRESTTSSATLRSMVDAPGEVTLPRTGYTVQSMDVYVDDARQITDGEIIWRMRASAVVVAPGGGGVERMTFTFDVAEYDDSFKVTALPRPIHSGSTPFEVLTGYSDSAELDSTLAAGAKNFATAYLVPDSSSSSLASTVTENYDGYPLSKTLWSTAEVISVNYYSTDSKFDLSSADTGDTVNVLITVKASTSSSTYSTIQLPVTMKMQSNGQWVVDAMDDLVYYQDIETK